jgi:hypothetical protein
MGAEGGADLVDVGAVGANGFVELVAGDAELFGPICNVGGHFGIDLFEVVRALGGVVFVKGVGFVAFGSVVVLGHVLPLFGFTWFDEEEVGRDVPADAEPLTANRPH